MSGNPTNVVPMPGSFPASQPWPPGAVPPGCFSELARLNQCYNEIQMMEMILSKVVCDLAANSAPFQQCLVNAIVASGSNVPLIGVTNGADAQPGQVGEYHELANVSITFPATTASTQIVTLGTLPAGDWDLQAWFLANGWCGGVQFVITPVSPLPPGLNNGLYGLLASEVTGAPAGINSLVVGQPGRLLSTAPTLIAFSLETNMLSDATATATTGQMAVNCRRAR